MLDFDAVVIGSGAGGLTAALALAQSGEKVLVLEQHYAPGGWCHSFQLGGFRFSPGVHYMGLLGPGGDLRKIYEGLGVANDLLFFELNRSGYEHCAVPGTRFDYPAGKDALADRFAARFPADARGIAEYLELARRVSSELGVIGETRGLWGTLAMPYRTRHLGRYGLYSLRRILEDRVRDPLARGLLGIQCGDHGLPPSKAIFALHAAITGHYLEGAYYPRGGGAALPRALMRALARAGGKVRREARVEKILVERDGSKRRAIGVRLADGTELRAKRVISNADPHATYGRLIGPDLLSKKLKAKLARTRYSTSALSLFLAVDMNLGALGYDSGNYWYGTGIDQDAIYERMSQPDVLEADELPGIFVSVTTLKDPTSYDGRHHTLEAFTFVPYEAFRPYAGTTLDDRPQSYTDLKARLKAKMLASVERVIPGISKHVVFSDLGTPLTNVHYVESTEGNIYGTEKTRRQLGPFAFSTRSEIQGLSLCGASTLSHGVGGATMSGLAAVSSLLGCRPSELLKAEGQALRTYPADDPGQWPDWLVAARNARMAGAEPSVATETDLRP